MMERPDGPTLDNLLRHAAHEFVAMTVAYECFRESGEESVPLFESFLVHARNGYVFLYKKPGAEGTHPKDVFAEDYVAQWSAVPSGELGQAYKRIHVQLTHLSSERAEPGNSYPWNTWKKKLPTIFDELDGQWKRFRDALDGTRRLIFTEGMEEENKRLRGD